MSPGPNKRPTGTVPKAKVTRKNSVPQEMVAPTRRDLQQHLNVSTHIIHWPSLNNDDLFMATFEPLYDEQSLVSQSRTHKCWRIMSTATDCIVQH